MVAEKTNIGPSQKQLSNNFNKYMYGFFTITSICLLFISKDWMMAVGNLGIALIFDPFDQKVTWNHRPLFQKIWLFVHVAVVLLLFGYGLFLK